MSFSTFEGEISGKIKLAGRAWRAESPRGTVLGVHGYSEYSGRYDHVATFLANRGFNVFWIDLPGHGNSSGRRGNIDSFHTYIEACEFLVQRAAESAKPLHLFGHSLGGLICLRFLQTSPLAKNISSTLLSCPLLGLNRFSEFKLRFLEVVATVLPNITLPNDKELGADSLTHDLEMQKSRSQDTLVNHVVTFHWFREFVRARRAAFREVGALYLPLGIMQAEEELVVSAEESQRFFNLIGAPQKDFKVYPKMRHELVNEVNRAQVLADMLNWFESQSLTRSFVSK